MRDLDVEQLVDAWRGSPPPDADVLETVRARVKRQSMRMGIVVAAEVLIAVTAVGASAVAALYDKSIEMWSLAVMVWCFTVAASAFSVVNRRGLWEAEHDAVSLLRLSLRRARAKERAAEFGTMLTLIETVFLGAWKAMRLLPHDASLWRFEGTLLLVGVAAAGWLMYYRAKARREGRTLAALLRSLEGESATDGGMESSL